MRQCSDAYTWDTMDFFSNHIITNLLPSLPVKMKSSKVMEKSTVGIRFFWNTR